MSGIATPIVLTVVAVIVALSTYRSIRRGGARFYTLEREAILRRASFSLIGSVLLFLAAIGLLLYERQEFLNQQAVESGAFIEGVPTFTPTPFLETQPPTPTMTPTPDPNIPTETPTPVIRRAIVEGTAGSGLVLRDAPGGTRIDVLPEGAILTLLDDEPVLANNVTWVKVRTIPGEEGWVAEDFLIVR